MNKPLTILFSSLEGVGHMNASIGLAEALRERGHRIIFAVSDVWYEKLISYGFEAELIAEPNHNDQKPWSDTMKGAKFYTGATPVEDIDSVNLVFTALLAKTQSLDPILRECAKRIEPDLIIINNIITQPSLVNFGKPWILMAVNNPLIFASTSAPPQTSGLSVYSKKELWRDFQTVYQKKLQKTFDKCNDWYQSNGMKRENGPQMTTYSPHLNLYLYPEELDYTDLRSAPPKWHRIDSFSRKCDSSESFVIPEKLTELKGNLIYFSFGTLGSNNVELMKRMVGIMAGIPHRFIVSKGPQHESYELADNMCGEEYVPQMNVLPVVDLVISHGGNNTITETLKFGKPMIIMPLSIDQYDNAQRLEDTGYGVRMNAFTCSRHELSLAIDKLLNDEILAHKLRRMAERMQSSDSVPKAVQLIENLVNK